MPSIRELGAKLVAVSADSVESLKAFRGKKLAFDVTLLSDSKCQVISRYGVIHPDGHGGGDIARPATFVIDKQGVVRWVKVTPNVMERPAPEEVIEALKGAVKGSQ